MTVRTAAATAASPLRRQFRTGLEAALRADADRFAQSKAQSVMGGVVKGLVREAQRGKPPAIRLMFAFLDQPEVAAGEPGERPAGAGRVENKQEICGLSRRSQGDSERIGGSGGDGEASNPLAAPEQKKAGGTPACAAEAASARRRPAAPGAAAAGAPAGREARSQGMEQEIRQGPVRRDWTDAGEWIAPQVPEPEMPRPEPARTKKGEDIAAETGMQEEETARRYKETMDRFFEETRELRARFAAEPPGSPLRVAQWRAAAEALGRPFEDEEPERTRVRLRFLRIATSQLEEEESLAALRAAGGEGLEIAVARSTTRCASWPKAYWLALLGSGAPVQGILEDVEAGDEQSQGIPQAPEPAPAAAAEVRAPPPFAVRIAGQLVEV